MVASISSIAASGFLLLSISTLYRTHQKRIELQAVKLELDLLDTEKLLHRSQKLSQVQAPTEIIYDCPAPESISQQKLSEYEKEHETEDKTSKKKKEEPKFIPPSSKQYKELEKPPIVDVVPGLAPIVEDYLAITDWKQEWKNRLHRHKKVCEKFPEKTPIFDQWMANGPEKQRDSYSLVDVKHKVVYCELPKCGCTNWKMTMRLMIQLPDLKEGEVVVDKGAWIMGKNNGRKKRDVEYFNPKTMSKRSPLPVDGDNLESIDNAIAEAIEDSENEEDTVEENVEVNQKLKIFEGDSGSDEEEEEPYQARNMNKSGRFTSYVLEQNFRPEDRVGVYGNGTYFRFIFVRHPLERLLSGYRDKVQRYFLNRPLFYGLRAQMYKEGKEDEYKELDIHGFHAFLRYLVIRGDNPYGGGTVRHWKKYYDLCRSCGHEWDFIGKMDSIYEDSEQVMERAGVKGRLHYGMHSKSTNYEKTIMYFKGVPKSLMMKIYDIFEVDFQAFGYTIPAWLWAHLSDE